MNGMSPLISLSPQNCVHLLFSPHFSLHMTVNIKSFNLGRVRTSPEVAGEEARPADRYCHAHLSLTPEMYLSLWKRHHGNAADLPVSRKQIHFSLHFSARKYLLCIWNAILKL
jgi:hypothetical protein